MAEGDGLLNRYTVKSRIGGSNPPLSASFLSSFGPYSKWVLEFYAFSISVRKRASSIKHAQTMFNVLHRTILQDGSDAN